MPNMILHDTSGSIDMMWAYMPNGPIGRKWSIDLMWVYKPNMVL